MSKKINPYHLYIHFDELSSQWVSRTNWQNELLIKCAFQSIELDFRIIRDIQKDKRITARSEERIERLFIDIKEQFELIRNLFFLEKDSVLINSLLTKIETRSPNIKALFKLKSIYRSFVIDMIMSFFDKFCSLPYGVGIETQLNDLLCKFNLKKYSFSKKLFLPYKDWVRPQVISKLHDEVPFGPEDRFFLTIHQSTECWFQLVHEYLTRIRVLALKREWILASKYLKNVSYIFEYLERHIQILELMVLADYHPLRVALKGSSGAQSTGAEKILKLTKRILAPIQEELKKRRIEPLQVYRYPGSHIEYYCFLEAINVFESRLSSFFYKHFQLAIKVQSTHGLGALGYGVNALVKRFIEPIYPLLDKTRYDHVMITNYENAKNAGILIQKKEAKKRPMQKSNGLYAVGDNKIQKIKVSKDIVRKVIRKFICYIQNLEMNTWLQIIDENGIIEDPIGTRPYVGHVELQGYFQNIAQTFNELHVREEGPLLIKGKEASVRWHAKGRLYNGKPIVLDGEYKFIINGVGKIQKVEVYWDPDDLALQF